MKMVIKIYYKIFVLKIQKKNFTIKIETTLCHQENTKKKMFWTTHCITSVANLYNKLTVRKLSLLVCSSAHLYLKYNGVNVIGYLFPMYKPTSHYLLFDFKVVLGPDINKLSDSVLSR